MPIINRIADFHIAMTEWHRRIHAHPETAFKDKKTAELICELLESFGISVDRGCARTGDIGTLKGSVEGGRAVALRPEMRHCRMSAAAFNRDLENIEGGARLMIEEGVLDKYPVEVSRRGGLWHAQLARIAGRAIRHPARADVGRFRSDRAAAQVVTGCGR